MVRFHDLGLNKLFRVWVWANRVVRMFIFFVVVLFLFCFCG